MVETPPTKTKNRRKDVPKDTDAPVPAPTPKKKPVCLYPPHKEKGFRHYLKDWMGCHNEEKDNLFEKLRVNKNDGIKRASSNDTLSSILLSATVCNKVRATVCIDIGSDATLIDNAMLKKQESWNRPPAGEARATKDI